MYSPKGRILCTENNPDARELIVFMLEAEGFYVTATESSTDALVLFQQEQFDLLLVDNWMPGLSGAELTREVRKFNQITPILFYSAAAYEANKEEAYEAGAQGYLVKPEGIDHLVDEVAKLIVEARMIASNFV